MGIAALLREPLKVYRTARTTDGRGGLEESLQLLGSTRGRITFVDRIVGNALYEKLGGQTVCEIWLSARGNIAIRDGDVLEDVYGRRYRVIWQNIQGDAIQATAARM